MIAIIIGVFGYLKINKVPLIQPIKTETDTTAGITSNNSFSHNVTLGFLSSGRIKSVLVKTGDEIKKGSLLATLDAGNAVGALSQAKAAYDIAQANYQKVINGATGPTIDVAKVAVNSAQVNLEGTIKQQAVLVENAHKNLLNSTPEALPYDNANDYTAPTISGSYNKDLEGQIILSIYASGGLSGYSFTTQGIVNATGAVTESAPEPIGDSGLFIKFPNTTINVTKWVINIPNTKATNYITNNNAYQLALQTQAQAIATAQATLDQAKVSLSALVSAARPEDIATAQAQIENASGALQIANATYNNTTILAPGDGTITAVYITVGQIATPSAPAIEFLELSN
jgi:HlyD family secretion protein